MDEMGWYEVADGSRMWEVSGLSSPAASSGSPVPRAGREEELQRFGLSLADFDMLGTLRRRAAGEPIKIRDLERSLMLSSGGTTKRLNRIEAAGLIERVPDPPNEREPHQALAWAAI